LVPCFSDHRIDTTTLIFGFIGGSFVG
jgi:hypothetical protein